MKRLLLICAVLMISGSAFAQKANVKKLKSKIEYASVPMNTDFSNVDPEKLQELRELIEPALTNPESENMHELWWYATRMKMYDMNAMLKQRAANNNEFDDPDAFFQNQYDLVTYSEKYYQLLNTPDEKGKLPLKDEEKAKQETLIQQIAKGPRDNLFIAATNLVNTDPEQSIKYMDLYYQTYENPLFKGAGDASQDRLLDSYYVYATAQKMVGGDKEKLREYLKKSMDSKSFGKNACFDLMELYKAEGDWDNWKTYCAQAIEKYPDEGLFGRSLIQQYINDKQYDKALELADKLIARDEANGKVDEWPYYFKAVTYFNTDKYEQAFDAFQKTTEVKPDFLEAVTGAGTTAWKLAQTNASNKAASKAWYDKAIKQFEQAKTIAPDQPEKWGYSLYACYNNSGQLDKAKQYKQYAK